MSGTNISNSNRVDSRVDHNFSANWRAFVRFSQQFKDRSSPFNHFNNPGTPSGDGPTNNTAKSLAIDNVYTINPTLFLNVRYGLNRKTNVRLPLSTGLTSAPAGQRAAELTRMLADPDIHCVVPPWGGETAIDLVDLLVNGNVIDEASIAKALADESELPYVEKPDPDRVPTALATRLPISFAKSHKVLVTNEDEFSVYVLVGDPFDTTALDELRVLFGKPVEASVSPATSSVAM